MHQVIVELDDRTLKRLNKVAPPRARKRSEFVRAAIRRALDLLAEEEMERAYREFPQDASEIDLDPEAWAAGAVPKQKRSAR